MMAGLPSSRLENAGSDRDPARLAIAAGLRHVVLDLLGPYEDRNRQIERFAAAAMPLLADLTGARS